MQWTHSQCVSEWSVALFINTRAAHENSVFCVSARQKIQLSVCSKTALWIHDSLNNSLNQSVQSHNSTTVCYSDSAVAKGLDLKLHLLAIWTLFSFPVFTYVEFDIGKLRPVWLQHSSSLQQLIEKKYPLWHFHNFANKERKV